LASFLTIFFHNQYGVLTGVVGAAGGFGGFLLPTLLGSLRQLTGSFGGGFLFFALIGLGCAVTLAWVSRSWEGVFIGRGGVASAAESSLVPAGLAEAETSRV
jgi:NNP family nitrate/nitrite transporter-like MFS transporter